MQQPPRKRRSERHAHQQESVRRPQYPDDTAPRVQYPSDTAPRVIYPDTARVSYQPDAQQAAYPQDVPQYPEYPDYPVSSAPVQPQYTPYTQPYAAPQQPAAYPQPAPRFAQNGNPPPQYPVQDSAYGEAVRPPRSHDGLWLLVILACIGALIAGGVWVSSLYSSHYPAFQAKVAALNQDTILYGVHVDGVHIGNMTRAQAQQALAQNAASSNEQFALNITIDGSTWRITQDQLPLARNIDAVLDQACALGRSGSLDTLSSSLTPFEARYQQFTTAGQQGIYLSTQITYDKSTVRQLADTLAARVYVQPTDAYIYDFDFSTRSFQYMPEQVGRSIASEDIYNAIVAHMDAHDYSAITLSTTQTAPAITAAQLSQSFGLISTYSTTTGDLRGYNRTKNIEIACDAVTGVVASGETFSFNSTTGRRTVDKGYLPAGAIASGTSVEEVGGGVCQVSSTLFNAAAMANMEIIYSSPHAWPSTYVAVGRDATVDWQSYQSLEQSLDLKFKNTSDYPIYIVAYVTDLNGNKTTSYNKDCKCTVEIYGVSFQEGITVDLETELISTTPAPDAEMRLNTELAYGTEKTIRQKHDGCVYKTYRVYYQNGVEIRRDLLRTSTYKPYAQIIEYNH